MSGINIKAPGDRSAELADALRSAASLEADVLITVGSGGDYATINAALAAASRIPVAYKKDGILVEVRLLTGFVMEEQVFVRNKDLSFITITSVDAVVTVNRSALTSQAATAGDYVSGLYPAFAGLDRAGIPTIGCLFDMDGSGTESGRTGFLVAGYSTLHVKRGAGMTNCAYRGIHAMAGIVFARDTVWDGSGLLTGPGEEGSALRAGNGSQVNIRDSSMQGCNRGVIAEGSIVNAQSVDATGCAAAIYEYSSLINADGLVAPNCTELAVTAHGGEISIRDAIVTDCGAAQAVWAAAGGLIVASGAQVKGTSDTHQIKITTGGRVVVLDTTTDGATPVAAILDSSSIFG